MRYIVLFFILLMCTSCFYAGSYHNAEVYIFEVSKDELVNKIRVFKDQNPEYKLVTTLENGQTGEYPDGFDEQGVFFYMLFYLEDRDMVLQCVINMSDYIGDTPSSILLNSVSDGIHFRSWKDFNTKSLSRKDNRELKKVFEQEILDQLNISWKKKRWWHYLSEL